MAYTLLSLLYVTQEDLEPCQHCISSTLELFRFYTSAEEVGRQTEDLLSGACPQMADVAQCETNVQDWWPAINAVYYNSGDMAGAICYGMDACDRKAL